MPIVPVKRDGTEYVARTRTPAAAETSADDTVGYGKPPKHTRFKAGQSGNPRGRPRRSKGFNTIVRETMLEPVKVRTARGEKTVTRAQALVLKTLESASKGNLRAAERLLMWFQQAVPEAPFENPPNDTACDMTETDAATLAAFRTMVLQQLEGHDAEGGGGQ